MPRKDKNIPSWQKSTFDQNSCVETKPISVKAIKKIEKEFYQKNKEAMRIRDPELYEFYRQEFGKKKKNKPLPEKQIKEAHVNSEKKLNKKNELDQYQEERRHQRDLEVEKIRQNQAKPLFNFKSLNSNKDPHRGMRWVSCSQPVNQGKLGSSQSWKYKKEKKYTYYW